MLQRRCKLGYARAARIIDEMEQMNIIGPYEGAKMCIRDRHCVAHVTQALTKIPGVDAQVSLENKEAVCTLTQDVSVQQLTDAVTEAGYSVTEVK